MRHCDVCTRWCVCLSVPLGWSGIKTPDLAFGSLRTVTPASKMNEFPVNIINWCYRVSGSWEQSANNLFISIRKRNINLWHRHKFETKCFGFWPMVSSANWHLQRVTWLLVTSKSLQLWTVWTAAVRLLQDYITKEWVEVWGGTNDGSCLTALHSFSPQWACHCASFLTHPLSNIFFVSFLSSHSSYPYFLSLLCLLHSVSLYL